MVIKLNPWQSLDLICQEYDRHSNRLGQQELRHHSRKRPIPLPDNNEMMRRFAVAISYSQGSQSKLVSQLIEREVFSNAFDAFNFEKLANRDPELIRKRYWKDLGYLRFRKKIDRIIQCAKVLEVIVKSHGTFGNYLRSFRVPRRIQSVEHINTFWEGFVDLKKDLKARKMPFFNQTTSLLQLLLDLDYDSAKPDLIVMRLARRIGIVDSETGESNLIKTVKEFQKYAVDRGIRLSAVDLCVLSFGGQTSARELLNVRFCPNSDPCHNKKCSVGSSYLCSSFYPDVVKIS